MTLMERRRTMMGAKSEANGLADKPLTSLSDGSYEVANGTIYVYPTIGAWNSIVAPLKKSIIAKQGDVLRIRAKNATYGTFANFGVLTNNGEVTVNDNCVLKNSMDISKTIELDCEILALRFCSRANNFKVNAQYAFTVLLNDVIIF